MRKQKWSVAERDIRYYCEIYVLNVVMLPMFFAAGRILITGNEVPLLASLSHDILCTWSGGDIASMSWYLQDLESIPLASTENSSVAVLHLDSSATGLNGCTFICRAVTFQGDVYEEHTTVQLKGTPIMNTTADIIQEGMHLYPLQQ